MLIVHDPMANPAASEEAHLPSAHPTASYWHKDPSPFLLHHRTSASPPPSVDVIIIGSGISGAFAAWNLLDKDGGGRDELGLGNLNVLMFEAREACWEATGRVCM